MKLYYKKIRENGLSEFSQKKFQIKFYEKKNNKEKNLKASFPEKSTDEFCWKKQQEIFFCRELTKKN